MPNSARSARKSLCTISLGLGILVASQSATTSAKPITPQKTTTTSAMAISGNTRGLSSKVVGLANQISRHFKRPIQVVSGCRSRAHNARINGARNSWHMRCMAMDIRVEGVSKSALIAYARKMPGRGGVGTYCRQSFIHIDAGPNRDWNWGCGGSKKSKIAKASTKGGRAKHTFYAKR
jgi:Peptidase M15